MILDVAPVNSRRSGELKGEQAGVKFAAMRWSRLALLGQNDQLEFGSVDWGEADLLRAR